MDSLRPPDFASIADTDAKQSFLYGRPEVVQWLTPGTKLFKRTQSITNREGKISAYWQFLQPRRLATNVTIPGVQELQTYAARLGVSDVDYTRARLGVTEQWNKMTRAVAIELVTPHWGYIGKAAGQRKNKYDSQVFFIGGEYQVWIPGLTRNDFRQIAIIPYLLPTSSSGAH